MKSVDLMGIEQQKGAQSENKRNVRLFI